MKRGIVAFLLSCFLLFCFNANATDSTETRVFDQASLLTDAATTDLENRIADFRQRYQLDLVVLTTKNTNDKTPRAYADDFYDDNGFGIGADKSGLLFLIDIGKRHSYISTSGRAIGIFSDSRIERILDVQFSSLKAGNYYNAFVFGIGTASSMIRQDQDRRVSPGAQTSPSGGGLLLWQQIVLAVLTGLAAGGIATMVVFSRYKKAFIPTRISERLDGSLTLSLSEDILVDTRITTAKIRTDSGSGSSGGSSTHRSSSGRTHGGGGRRF